MKRDRQTYLEILSGGRSQGVGGGVRGGAGAVEGGGAGGDLVSNYLLRAPCPRCVQWATLLYFSPTSSTSSTPGQLGSRHLCLAFRTFGDDCDECVLLFVSYGATWVINDYSDVLFSAKFKITANTNDFINPNLD